MGNRCGLTHLILTFHGWLDHRPTNGQSLLRALSTACAHGPQSGVPRCPKTPGSLGPLGSPPREPMLFDWPDRYTRPSLTWDRSACQRDASLESLHSVQPSPSHFSASVLTASPILISKQRFPLPLSGLQSESHSNTATRQQIASINMRV
jgi:hypothetical protein